MSHQHHDKCIVARNMLRDANPELFAKATARGVWVAKGTPEYHMKLNVDALDAMASSFATGAKVSNANQRRAAKLVAMLDEGLRLILIG